MSEKEDKENELQLSSDQDALQRSAGNGEIPSAFLPDVLHRLGLSPVGAPLMAPDPIDGVEERGRSEALQDKSSSSSLADVRTALKSEDWSVRAAAVRALGKLEASWERG